MSVEINGQNDISSFLRSSEIHFERQDYQLALEDAKAAYKLDQQNIDACICAGRSALKLKRFEESYTFYKEGITIDPQNKTIAMELKDLQKIIVKHYEKESREITEPDYNAVDMCTQDIYPGDDELFLLEKEILVKKFKVDCSVQNSIADVNKRKEAAKTALIAHNHMMTGEYKDALRQCGVTLDVDPGNIAARHLRAHLYEAKGDTEQAVQDLMAIPKPNRAADVWKLGGILLHRLNLPVMSEFWYRKATSMSQKKDVEAAMLFQKVRIERIYGPLTAEFPVKVDFTKYGRGIFATENLSEGENAFEDKPVVLGKLLNFINDPACDHCAGSILPPSEYFGDKYEEFDAAVKNLIQERWPKDESLPCPSCKRETYCNKKCQTEAWEQYHHIICPAKNKHAQVLYDLRDAAGWGTRINGSREEIWPSQYDPVLLARMWAMIVVVAKILMRQSGHSQPTVEHWAKAKMPFRKFISYGKSIAASKMPEVLKIMQSVFIDCGDGVKYDITEREFNARYYQATCNLQAFAPTFSTPLHAFLKEIADVEDLATMRLLKHVQEEPKVASFAGMFPLHACLNHACDNNVEIIDGKVDGRPGVHVRVFRDIKPGEELFTTYIDTTMPRKLRRAWLYKSFNFWCQCRRCQFEGDGPDVCTNCEKLASEDKKFPHCGKCQNAWYCSVKCQKQAWVKGHKVICQMKHSRIKSKPLDVDQL